MFLGATGPLVAAVIAARDMGRERTVGALAAAMTVQHLLKTLVFGIVGFAWAERLPLIAAMIATGFLGTLAGRRALNRLPESEFRRIFRRLLTGLAMNLAWQAIFSGAA